jgi:hypothetical protein
VRKREQLGQLLAGWQPTLTDDFIAELLLCSARVVALSRDGDLFFIGRSPDSLFDVLSGILAGTTWEERLRPLPVSLRWEGWGRRTGPRHALQRYLASMGLAPPQLVGRPRPAVLVDIVSRGLTFGELVRTWHD